jgi:hypothetical protein
MARRKTDEDVATAVGGVALVASILANLKQYSGNEELRRSVEALQRLVKDWQRAYHEINGQLSMALRANEEQNNLISSLRKQVDEMKGRAYEAEERALRAEAVLSRLRATQASAVDEAPVS